MCRPVKPPQTNPAHPVLSQAPSAMRRRGLLFFPPILSQPPSEHRHSSTLHPPFVIKQMQIVHIELSSPLETPHPMSQENAQKFLDATQQDPALQAQIQNLDTSSGSEAIVQFARSLGFDFTPEELQSALAASTSRPLDDATLEHVVGGGGVEDFFSWLGDAMKNTGLGKRITRGGSRPF